MGDFNEPAYPHNETDHAHGATSTRKPGLTIRQQAVLMAMQGIASNPMFNPTRQEHFDNAAIDAILLADAVLRAEREIRE